MNQEKKLLKIIIKIILGIGLFEVLFRIFNGSMEREAGNYPAFWPIYNSGFPLFLMMVKNILSGVTFIAILILLLELTLTFLRGNFNTTPEENTPQEECEKPES